jgi:hypothetical protein
MLFIFLKLADNSSDLWRAITFSAMVKKHILDFRTETLSNGKIDTEYY